MKRRTLIALLLLVTTVLVMAVPACITSPDDKKDKIIDQPSPPPDNPPPDPPPPPASTDHSPIPTLEEIAGDVLQGEYGPELQQLLADEVSVCLNMMIESGMISVSSSPDGMELERIETEASTILYSDRYIMEWILDGRYGETATYNLLSFIRSFESK